MYSIARLPLFRQCLIVIFMKLQQMKSLLTLCISLAFFALVCILSPLQAQEASEAVERPDFEVSSMQVKTKDKVWDFTIEIAQTREQLLYGLMERKFLAEDYAMLFIFPDEKKRFMWMKNTPLALDMLFVDKAGKIIHIHKNAVPNSLDKISAPKPIRAVIEMPAGAVEKKQIAVGDTVIHSLFDE